MIRKDMLCAEFRGQDFQQLLSKKLVDLLAAFRDVPKPDWFLDC